MGGDRTEKGKQWGREREERAGPLSQILGSAPGTWLISSSSWEFHNRRQGLAIQACTNPNAKATMKRI